MNHDKTRFSTLENVSLILGEIIPDLHEIVEEKNICGNECRSCQIAEQIHSIVLQMQHFAHTTSKEVNRGEIDIVKMKGIIEFNPERDTVINKLR